MGIITIFLWLGICTVSLYAIIYFVIGARDNLWPELFLLALAITFIEFSRNFIYILESDSWAVLGARIAVAVIVASVLYLYAHFRLGLVQQKEKLLIATIYPGIKLVLYVIFIGRP